MYGSDSDGHSRTHFFVDYIIKAVGNKFLQDGTQSDSLELVKLSIY